ncbi:MAG: hypothetical protein ACI9UN_000054 [Granulosicoccus sp.]|jgi:hypothetical protein
MRINEYLTQMIRSPFLALVFLFIPMTAHAAELLMIEEPGCVYCVRFNREISPAYPKTDEGKLAPLRRLQLSDPWPASLAGVRNATVTPTFILVDNGVEIDRLVGYPGDEHFWFLLSQMLEKL